MNTNLTALADKTFYKEQYKGFLIPEDRLDHYLLRATNSVRANAPQLPTDGNQAAMLATCEIADIIFKATDSTAGEITSERVGNYAITYGRAISKQAGQETTMYNIVRQYLSEYMYAGVAVID